MLMTLRYLTLFMSSHFDAIYDFSLLCVAAGLPLAYPRQRTWRRWQDGNAPTLTWRPEGKAVFADGPYPKPGGSRVSTLVPPNEYTGRHVIPLRS